MFECLAHVRVDIERPFSETLIEVPFGFSFVSMICGTLPRSRAAESGMALRRPEAGRNEL